MTVSCQNALHSCHNVGSAGGIKRLRRLAEAGTGPFMGPVPPSDLRSLTSGAIPQAMPNVFLVMPDLLGHPWHDTPRTTWEYLHLPRCMVLLLFHDEPDESACLSVSHGVFVGKLQKESREPEEGCVLSVSRRLLRRSTENSCSKRTTRYHSGFAKAFPMKHGEYLARNG